jgi:hypothetical protein
MMLNLKLNIHTLQNLDNLQLMLLLAFVKVWRIDTSFGNARQRALSNSVCVLFHECVISECMSERLHVTEMKQHNRKLELITYGIIS